MFSVNRLLGLSVLWPLMQQDAQTQYYVLMPSVSFQNYSLSFIISQVKLTWTWSKQQINNLPAITLLIWITSVFILASVVSMKQHDKRLNAVKIYPEPFCWFLHICVQVINSGGDSWDHSISMDGCVYACQYAISIFCSLMNHTVLTMSINIIRNSPVRARDNLHEQ